MRGVFDENFACVVLAVTALILSAGAFLAGVPLFVLMALGLLFQVAAYRIAIPRGTVQAQLQGIHSRARHSASLPESRGSGHTLSRSEEQ